MLVEESFVPSGRADLLSARCVQARNFADALGRACGRDQLSVIEQTIVATYFVRKFFLLPPPRPNWVPPQDTVDRFLRGVDTWDVPQEVPVVEPAALELPQRNKRRRPK